MLTRHYIVYLYYIVKLSHHCSTNSGPPSVKRLFRVLCFFCWSPSYTVGQVPLAYLAYPWTVTYIHTYIHTYNNNATSTREHGYGCWSRLIFWSGQSSVEVLFCIVLYRRRHCIDLSMFICTCMNAYVHAMGITIMTAIQCNANNAQQEIHRQLPR